MVNEEKQSFSDLLKTTTSSSSASNVCFVCDQKIIAEKSTLATSVAPHSKLGLAEKISELVGDEYVVIVTDQDLICKRCSSLVNHMDKLENELVLVKKALINYIKQKYNLPLEEPIFPSATNCVNDEHSEEQTNESEDSQQLSADANRTPVARVTSASSFSATPSPASAVANSIANKKRPGTKLKDIPTKMKPQQPVPKMKIYKCGFCNFQSKELNNVRAHMKIHAKANTKREELALTVPTPKQQPAPQIPAPVQRRLFRCQVCSLSFSDRSKCVEHISLEHTSVGKKRGTLEEKKSLNTDVESKSQAEFATNTTIATTKDDTVKTEDTTCTFVPDTSAYFNTDDGGMDISSNAMLLNTDQTTELPSLLSDDLTKENETEFHINATPMETESLNDTLESQNQGLTSGYGKSIELGTKTMVSEKPLRKIFPKPMDSMTLSPLRGILKSSMSENSTFNLNVDESGDVMMDTSDKLMEEDNDGKKNVHSIDIEAMIAALHSDGPATSL